jgi:hypothetical protein
MSIRGRGEALKDEKGSVLGLLLKLSLVVVVVGFLITQAGPVLWNHVTIRTVASDAADLAVLRLQESRASTEKVTKAIRETVEEGGARLVGEPSYTYDISGRITSVSFTIRRITRTYIFYRVGFLAPFTEATYRISREVTY